MYMCRLPLPVNVAWRGETAPVGGIYVTVAAELPILCAGNFSRIIVYDRASHRLVEEQISPTLVLAMRNMYQSRVRGVSSTLRLMRVNRIGLLIIIPFQAGLLSSDRPSRVSV